MPAARKTQEYVKNELPYKLLMSIYENSRASLREIGKKLNISYHVVHAVLKDLESRYQIVYTLDLDEGKLGFAEGRLITIKFGIKPSIDIIKQTIKKEFFIQDAYLAEGDFDLLLYVVGVDPRDFQRWQWNLRVALNKYRPELKFSSVSLRFLGVLPLRNDLIKESKVLSDSEKVVLTMLNDDSRIKLSHIVKKLKITPDRATYIIKKLCAMGIIKKFTSLVQNPDKRIFYAYCVSLMPSEKHTELIKALANEMIKEDMHETVNDYALAINTNGDYDMVHLCAFKNGEDLSRRGPELLRSLWTDEEPKIEKAMLTDVVVGKWPFHLEAYDIYRKEVALSK